MEVVAGAIASSAEAAEARCQRLLAPLTGAWPDSAAVGGADANFACGAAKRPRGESETAPLLLCGGDILAAAAGRLGDTAVLCETLGLDPAAGKVRILAEAWLRWGPSIGSRVSGDWVLAVWTGSSSELALVRAPAASTSLYYADSGEGPVFASLAQAISRSGLVSCRPDWAAIASFMNDHLLLDDRTGFREIRRVRAGHAACWRNGRWSEKPIWSPPAKVGRGRRDWVADYRRCIERAVEQCLPASGAVASQLSAGRDSSAVTALAARAAPGRLVAITLVPPRGSVGPDDERLIYDEGRQARETARALGIRHETVEGGTSEERLSWLEQVQEWQYLPAWSALGPGLWMASAAAAAGVDAKVMLSGSFGNLGLSSGGIKFLSALREEEGWARWAPVARTLAVREGWRTILHHSAPVPARMAWRRLRERLKDGAPGVWRGALAAATAELRPPANRDRNAREEVRRVIDEMDMANPHFFLRHRLDLVDPTADRALLELMLQAPASLLVDGSGGRPLFQAAFRDLLPEPLLRERRRGRQAADWWMAFDPAAVARRFEEVGRNALIAEVIDVAEARRQLGSWPRSFAEAAEVEDQFREILGALSIALFLKENF